MAEYAQVTRRVAVARLASRRPAAPGSLPGLLALQRQAGNRAVAQLLDEGSAVAGPPQILTSPILAGEPRLQAAAASAAKAIRFGERGAAVQTLQHALVELGSTAAKTMAKGKADGIYGEETFAAVRDFQKDHDVRPVGGREAGPKTLKALDQALAGRPGTTPQGGKTGQVPTGIEIRQAVPGQLKPTGPPARNPEAQPAATGQTKVEGVKDPEKAFEVEGSVGVKGAYKFERGPRSRFEWAPPCDQGEISLTGKFNLRGVPVDGQGRFTLFPELTVDVGLQGPGCEKHPSLMANFTWWKFQAWKSIELSMNSGLGIESPPFGWVAKTAALEAEVKLPGNSAFVIGGALEHKAAGDDHETAIKGTVGLTHTFDTF